jgi:hypothetical protein
MGQITDTSSHDIEHAEKIKNQYQTLGCNAHFWTILFQQKTMTPPGTRIIAHETPSRRKTWAPHGQDGWYIGPALEHYRCYTVYITKTKGNRIVETVDFLPKKITLPFPSSQDVATQAAADLTHALIHPQPAGPFCQVGNEQTIALKRLAIIFEGAKQRKSKNTLTPKYGIENTAPQRVQTTVSPPRVAGTDAAQISLQPISSSQSIPNSHRHIVTPQTPHVMVRRSAGQQHNVSQDMMAETINQGNHCFAISAQPQTQCTKKPSDNTEVILLPEIANAVICPETGKSLKHQELITKLRYKIKWMRSTANEINRLYNTYGSFVVDIKDHKEEKERTRLTVGGDQIEYPGDKSTLTAGLTSSKILINSVISTLGAKFLVIDNFYLNTPPGRFEYMVINLASLPQETIKKYDPIELSQDGKVYINIQKGMYGLPQEGILANELLQCNLAKDGYRPTTHTHGLCTHDTRPISFSLVVDDSE